MRWKQGVLLLAALVGCAGQSSLECQHLADTYLTHHHKEAAPYNGTNMVYFLHVPRTAGRTFQSCFLKMATAPSKRCPKAYDHLRLNMEKPNCQLLSSHDDFSVVSMLPEGVAVLTHLRDPVDRMLSAYEFAIEVAARYAFRPTNFKKRLNKVATEDVWPWSYLIPFFAADLKPKLEKLRAQPVPEAGVWIPVEHPDGDKFFYNKVLNQSKYSLSDAERALLLPPLNPYDNEMVMPLKDFVKHPIAHELLHNGAAFQVLGITNYSHWGDAAGLRKCANQVPSAADHLLGVAKARVGRFFHVGVTDLLFESVVAAAVEYGKGMDSLAYTTGDGDMDNGAARGQRDAAAGGGGASDIPEIAKKLRDTRLELQGLQKQIFKASQAGRGAVNPDEMMALKRQANALRSQLREQQERMAAARAQLPTGADDGSSAEAGFPVQRQPARDPDSMTLPGPLGVEFQRCAQRAQNRNLQRRDQALATMAMPDGRSLMFSKAARKAIPPEVTEYIRSHNKLDTALHQLGTTMLRERNEQYRKEGRLQDLPQIPPVRLAPRAFRKTIIPKPERDEL